MNTNEVITLLLRRPCLIMFSYMKASVLKTLVTDQFSILTCSSFVILNDSFLTAFLFLAHRCLMNCSTPSLAVLLLLLQDVLVKNCGNAIIPSPVNTAYFKLLSVATTLMQQLVLECSLMSVPPGCGSKLPVLIYQWPHLLYH